MNLVAMLQRRWQPRSPHRLSDRLWHETLHRVRAEFDEMPCMRLTRDQARALLGLPATACEGVLRRLVSEGFLWRTPQGEYRRRSAAP